MKNLFNKVCDWYLKSNINTRILSTMLVITALLLISQSFSLYRLKQKQKAEFKKELKTVKEQILGHEKKEVDIILSIERNTVKAKENSGKTNSKLKEENEKINNSVIYDDDIVDFISKYQQRQRDGE
tara:strand:+ start:570 stop:950 length:381 start_codon:yes stop_codon:yes gene_type:complete